LDGLSIQLIHRSEITDATINVSPDALADQVRTAKEALQRLHDQPIEHPATQWADAVATWLEGTAVPIFDRQQPLDAGTAVTIRLAAICLAGEARSTSNPVGLQFRQIAAGITLLERRLTSQTPPVEIIFMALA